MIGKLKTLVSGPFLGLLLLLGVIIGILKATVMNIVNIFSEDLYKKMQKKVEYNNFLNFKRMLDGIVDRNPELKKTVGKFILTKATLNRYVTDPEEVDFVMWPNTKEPKPMKHFGRGTLEEIHAKVKEWNEEDPEITSAIIQYTFGKLDFTIIDLDGKMPGHERFGNTFAERSN